MFICAWVTGCGLELLVVVIIDLDDITDVEFFNDLSYICGSFDIDNFMGDFDSSPLATMLQAGSSLPDAAELFD